MSTVDIAAMNRAKIQELHEDISRLQNLYDKLNLEFGNIVAERDRLRELMRRCILPINDLRKVCREQDCDSCANNVELLIAIQSEGVE